MENKKFRVWNKVTKNFTYITLGIDECPVGEQYVYQQCLDTKDKYSNILYEGDIVISKGYYNEIVRINRESESVEYSRFFLSFFTLKNQFGNSEIFGYSTHLIKEGNIFETPELLDKNKKIYEDHEPELQKLTFNPFISDKTNEN